MFAAQQNCRKVYNSSFPERIETIFVSTESLELIVLAREEEEEPLLIYTAQGSPFRCKKLSVINGSPERNNVLKLCIHMHYTNTNNNIDRKLCTNKRFRSK